MSVRTDYAVCILCEALCGLEVEHDGTRVHKVRGDAQDPFSRGHICPKGVALADIQNDPDRLRHPLRRNGAGWQEVSWESALDETAERLHQIQRQHGRDAVAIYTGNPAGHSYAGVLYRTRLLDVLDTHNKYSANPVDGLPRLLASFLMYGNQAILPIPDIDRTQLMYMFGANPLVSNGSIMTAPDVAQRIKDLRARGGKLVVFDPRRTQTAEVADAHYAIKPGSDAFLLAAMVHTLFDEGLSDPGRLFPMLDGWDMIPALLADFTPERVADRVGISAGEIVQLARELAASPAGVCYGRMGTCTQEFGLLASWLIDILNIATGSLDRVGGAMFTTGAVALPELARRVGQPGSFDRWRSRVSDYPEFNGEPPVAAFAEEMETPGEGQIRALITHAGNPVLSLPNGRRLERAFQNLDFMVSIDIYCNETTRHANLILPTTFGLERDEYPVVGHSTAVRNTAHYSPALLEKPDGLLEDWEVLLELTERLGRKRGGLSALSGRLTGMLGRRLGPRGLLRLLLRMGPHNVSLDDLEENPHGIDLGPLEPRLPELLGKQKRIRVAPEVMRRDLPRLVRKLETPLPSDHGSNGLLLIGRRSLRSNNSWMHNSERLVSGKHRCVLLMHPDDAERRGLSDGQHVIVKTHVGEVETPLEVTEDIMPGVVSLPHGWGHDPEGNGQRVATAHPGVSLNDVIDDGLIDAASGASSLNGIPVNVIATSA